MRKRNLISIVYGLIIAFSTFSPAYSNHLIPQNQLFIQTDTILSNLQNKIQWAINKDIKAGEIQELEKINQNLASLHKQHPQKIIRYWQAYAQFYTAIAYTELKNKSEAEKANDIGIQFLKELEHKNSEDYALLALMQGFSIPFKGMRVVFISSAAKENAQLAIRLDTTNLRAYYVAANNDFYTPKAYGGGLLVEKYLIKAISLPDQRIKNPYMPSWGREESYQLLIRYYLKNNQPAKAKIYYQKAISLFPQSDRIKRLEEEINKTEK